MRNVSMLFALALGACASGPQSTAVEDIFGSWHFAGARDLPMGTRIPTLRFAADGSLTGCSGINRFRGTLDAAALANGEWRLTGLAGTNMAGTQPAMQFEMAFVEHLRSADRVTRTDGVLMLQQGDLPLLAFLPVQMR